MRYTLQPILLDVQKQTSFDLLKTPLEEVQIGCTALTELHRNLINLLICDIEGHQCWIGEGKIWPDIIGDENRQEMNEVN